ncbi:MAG: manganese catalase family protein [Chloroflexi bacterium]|nr:manganese catalase family protein [Chloroflexota bacterium]MCL5074888.1 manganese catalase family protein [Chloroflexota bacterium]
MAITSSPQEIITLLNEDITREHETIVQYLQHAYAIGEGAIACAIEEIAREEMWHLEWLSERVVGLGGDPTLERGGITIEKQATAMLRDDIAQEEKAIAQYRRHIEAIGDEGTKKMLERILADEESHRDQFESMVKELEAAEGAAIEQTASPATQPIIGPLNADIRDEYTAILQYLHQSFIAADPETSNELEHRAIEEMKHLGWLSERVAELGGEPHIERGEIDRSVAIPEMLRANIRAEQQAQAQYSRHIEEIADPEVKSLLSRINLQEAYHEYQFKEMLEEAEKSETPAPAAPSPTGLTVGSLLGREQE